MALGRIAAKLTSMRYHPAIRQSQIQSDLSFFVWHLMTYASVRQAEILPMPVWHLASVKLDASPISFSEKFARMNARFDKFKRTAGAPFLFLKTIVLAIIRKTIFRQRWGLCGSHVGHSVKWTFGGVS